jgi:hypothetical protein
VDADFLSGGRHCTAVLGIQSIDLFPIEVTETVDDHHHLSRRFCDLAENRVDL